MKGQYDDTADLQAWLTELWRTGVIDGVTLSGGEPLEQAHAIETLLTGLRIAIPLLSIGVFSGYTERELVAGRFRTEGVSSAQRSDLWTRIRTCLDFAVLGRFNKWTPSSRPLVSSRNQNLILISNRYSIDDFEDQGVEITIEADGLTQITGFPVARIHPA
jgi:anaerobic ribonucleoside-triphosphate reductase activating protein